MANVWLEGEMIKLVPQLLGEEDYILCGAGEERRRTSSSPQKLAHRLICGFHAHYSIAKTPPIQTTRRAYSTNATEHI